MSGQARAGEPIDLAAGAGRAVLWGLATDDLNVNLVAWPAGEGVGAHVNDARDVLIVVVAGALTVTIDDVPRSLPADSCLVIPKGAHRTLVAGAEGARYLTVHRRRPGIQVG